MKKSIQDEFKLSVSNRLNRIMDIRNIPNRVKTTWLKNELGGDLVSAGRKLKGITALNMAELKKIAEELECSTDYLLGLTDNHCSSEKKHSPFQAFGVEVSLSSKNSKLNNADIVSGYVDSHYREKCIAWISKEATDTRKEDGVFAWKDNDDHLWTIGSPKDSKDVPVHEVYSALTIYSDHPIQQIAVLDDRIETAEIMQTFLEDAGFIAETFTNLHDIKEKLNKTRFDAFVLDWALGNGQNSEQLIIDIRNSYGNHIPIILLTGEATESEIERAIKLNVRYFQKNGIFKPIIAQINNDLKNL